MIMRRSQSEHCLEGNKRPSMDPAISAGRLKRRKQSRELFPDTVVAVVSIFECGDHAIAEWNLTATQNVPYGSIYLRLPISLKGTSVVHVKDGRITEWSDCYDQNTSRRVSLAAFFTEWIEY
jgi:hypothetical protein